MTRYEEIVRAAEYVAKKEAQHVREEELYMLRVISVAVSIFVGLLIYFR
jgi:hypothetical protein